jgi:surface polysaccharide O-acyltransferase-like enzyme
MTETNNPPHSLWPSVAAVLLGLFVIFALSLVTDQVLHMLEVYPPWGQPMYDTSDNLLALAYRIVYAVIGCYIAARLAPRNPMHHALALGVVGFVFSLAGAIAASQMSLGPIWHPIALALTALPCAWLGGALHQKRLAGG